MTMSGSVEMIECSWDPVVVVLPAGAVPLFEVTHTAACTEQVDTSLWQQLQECSQGPLGQ